MIKQSFEHSGFRLLIVDDTPDIHQDIRKILSWNSVEETPLHRLESALFEETANSKKPSELPTLRIDSAYQGQQAIDMVQQALQDKDPYQLIFMDVRMPPGMDGIEATQQIWKIQPDVIVIVCTAYSDYSIDMIIHKLGISDKMLLLNKPFPPTVLKQSTITMLRKWDVDYQLQRHTRNLEKLVTENADLADKAINLSHALITPLDTIYFLAQQMEKYPLPELATEEVKRNIHTISSLTERLQKAVTVFRSTSNRFQENEDKSSAKGTSQA